MLSAQSNKGFVLLAVMLLLMVMTTASLFMVEMNIHNLKNSVDYGAKKQAPNPPLKP